MSPLKKHVSFPPDLTLVEPRDPKRVSKPRIYLFEDVLDAIGGFGKFQVLIMVLLFSLEIPTAFVTFIPIFISAQPTKGWLCDGEEIDADYICECNGTLSSYSADSIVSEWSLVCKNTWVSDFITAVQMSGMFIGNICGSQFADWYGRKFGFLAAILVLAIGSAVSAVAPNPFVYGIARFFCGAGIPAFINITCMGVMEFMPPKWRSLSNSVGPTGEGIMILSLLAYWIRPWRTLCWATLAPFFLVVVIYPFVPESPRWLLRQGRLKEAHKALAFVAKINGSPPIGIEILEKIAQAEQQESQELLQGKQRFGYLQFFKEKSLRKTCLFMMAIWFAWAFTYFGISYNIKNLDGNIYLNMCLIGLANSVGQRGALLMNDRVGRRKSLFLSMTFCALALVLLAICTFVFTITGDVFNILAVSFCFLGQLGMASARSAARLLSGESFPTPVRTMGLGLGGVASNVAGTVTPFLALIGSRWPAIPYLCFAVVSVCGSLVSFLMAETMGAPLSDQIQQTKRPPSERKFGCR